jgi:hypothetical protein
MHVMSWCDEGGIISALCARFVMTQMRVQVGKRVGTMTNSLLGAQIVARLNNRDLASWHIRTTLC